MSVTRLGAILASILVAALLAAGCGGTSKADYEADVSKIGEAVEKDLDKLDSGQPSPDVIEDVQGTLEEAAEDLDGIDPPSEVSDLHDDLVEVLRDTAGLFDDLAPLMAKATDDPESMGQEELDRMTAVTDEFAGIEERMGKIQKGFADEDYEIGLGGVSEEAEEADAEAPDSAE